MGGGEGARVRKKIKSKNKIKKKKSVFKVVLQLLSFSTSAIEQISLGVLNTGNTAVWIVSIPFIMYEHKCYKLAVVKTSMLHLDL